MRQEDVWEKSQQYCADSKHCLIFEQSMPYSRNYYTKKNSKNIGENINSNSLLRQRSWYKFIRFLSNRESWGRRNREKLSRFYPSPIMHLNAADYALIQALRR